MFEQALAESKVSNKRKASFISSALIVHAAVLLGVVFAQYWTVAAVEEPPIMVSFFEAAPPPPPPPPPAPPPPPKAAAPTPVETPKPIITEPVQPEIVPEELPPEGPVVSSEVGVEGGVEGGIPGGVVGGVPGGVEGGIPQEAPEDQIFQVGGNVEPPVIISRTPPTYTETARRARTQGTVVLEAVINKQGEVTNVKVLKSLPFGLDRQAVESIQRWKFKPATMDGRPVSVYYVLTVQFKIQ